MTRDATLAKEIWEAATVVGRLHSEVERYEAEADHNHADLHAVLYGKIADALQEAYEALGEAADLADPEITDVSEVQS